MIMRLILAAVMALIATTAYSADKIYKTVDENGNIVYTNDPKDENAEAVDLPELGVVEAGEQADLSMEAARRAKARTEARSDAAQRKPYGDLAITSPAEEEAIWGSAGNLEVTVDSGDFLAPGHRIRVMLDGSEIPQSEDGTFRIDQVYQGEHKLTAQVVDAAGNVLAKSGTRTFYMKQASVNRPGSSL